MLSQSWRRLAGGAGLAAALPLTAALAQAERQCDMSAYTTDNDPKGINVRSGPSNQAKIIAVIKVKKNDDVQVSIVAESNGWFRIKEYSHFAMSKDVKVSGWLHGSRLAANLMIMQASKASERLLEEPSDRSKTLLLLTWEPGEDRKPGQLYADLPGGKRETIDFAKIKGAAEAMPLACTNGYVKVRVHKYEGWLKTDRLCGSPVTTCN